MYKPMGQRTHTGGVLYIVGINGLFAFTLIGGRTQDIECSTGRVCTHRVRPVDGMSILWEDKK